MSITHRCKKIEAGHYLYRGYEIFCRYHQEFGHSVAWEAIDEWGCAFAHSYTLKECMEHIDGILDTEEGRECVRYNLGRNQMKEVCYE